MFTGGFFVNTVTINGEPSKGRVCLFLMEDFYAEKNTRVERQRNL